MKVLLVDDDPDIRMVAMIALKSVGQWDVMEADSGADALGKAEAYEPDLILLDMMLPGMDGMATLAALRRRPGLAHTPAIFMTAKVREADVARYLAAGATGVIQKPFDPMALPGEVQRILKATSAG